MTYIDSNMFVICFHQMSVIRPWHCSDLQGLHPHRGPFVIDVKERGPLTFTSAFAVFSFLMRTVEGSKITTYSFFYCRIHFHGFRRLVLFAFELIIFICITLFFILYAFNWLFVPVNIPDWKLCVFVKQAFSWMFAAIIQFFRLVLESVICVCNQTILRPKCYNWIIT